MVKEGEKYRSRLFSQMVVEVVDVEGDLVTYEVLRGPSGRTAFGDRREHTEPIDLFTGGFERIPERERTVGMGNGLDEKVESAIGIDVDKLTGPATDILELARGLTERDGKANTVWIEIRITQGHDYSAGEINEVSAAVENATDVPASRAFCTAERNLLFCYLRLDVDRLPIGRLTLFQHELRGMASEWTGRAVDEINVVDEAVVRERVPSAV